VKQAVSMRLDADVVVWLKKPGKGYRPAPTAFCDSARMLDEIRRA